MAFDIHFHCDRLALDRGKVVKTDDIDEVALATVRFGKAGVGEILRRAGFEPKPCGGAADRHLMHLDPVQNAVDQKIGAQRESIAVIWFDGDSPWRQSSGDYNAAISADIGAEIDKDVRLLGCAEAHEMLDSISLEGAECQLTSDRFVEAHDEIGAEIVGDEEAIAADRGDKALTETPP